MSKIQGKDFILYMVTSASPQVLTPIGCARSVVLTTAVNIAGISTVGSGTWQEFKALSINWNVTTDGLCTFGENMTIALLRTYQFALEPVYFTMKQSTPSAGTAEYSGYCIIMSVAETGSYNDVMNYSIQLQGTGSLFNSSDFRIISIELDTPMAGQTTLEFDWTPYPGGANAYTIRTTNLTTGAISNSTGGDPPRTNFVIDSTNNYSFSYRPEFDWGNGPWSPEIFYEPN